MLSGPGKLLTYFLNGGAREGNISEATSLGITDPPTTLLIRGV